MLTINILIFLSSALFCAALLEPVAERMHVPFSILLVVIGYLGSEFVTRVLDINTGIHWENFGTIIFYIILPILIFESAISIRIKSLRENIVPVIILALPLTLLAAGIIAAGVYFGIAHPSGFPWLAALLTGALLSATDPAAVLALLKKTNISGRLNMLLEGESLLNDATAIVLFTVIIGMTVSSAEAVTWSAAGIRFLAVFFGGLAMGAMIGMMACALMRYYSSRYVQVIITLITAYLSYILAEDYLHLSGVMAVLAAGILIGNFRQANRGDGNREEFVNELWGFFSYVAESLIFLLAGVTVTLSMFTEQWLAMLIGIGAVLVSRGVVIYGTFPVMNALPGIKPVSIREQTVLVWGGVRGTITLALALSLPLSLDYWYTIQSIAYGVVLFTLFVQTTTMRLLIKKWINP